MRKKILFIGITISLLSFCIYFFAIEDPVHERRFTYTVSSTEYSGYFDAMDAFFVESNSHSISLTPNFSSLGDSLAEKEIRRFELRVFHSGISSYSPAEYTALYYFEKTLGLPAPEIVTNRYVSSSRPLKRSLGIAILLMCCSLLIDLFLARKH